jgi:hypothetical protein
MQNQQSRPGSLWHFSLVVRYATLICGMVTGPTFAAEEPGQIFSPERAWARSEVTNELPSELHFTLNFFTC